MTQKYELIPVGADFIKIPLNFECGTCHCKLMSDEFQVAVRQAGKLVSNETLCKECHEKLTRMMK